MPLPKLCNWCKELPIAPRSKTGVCGRSCAANLRDSKRYSGNNALQSAAAELGRKTHQMRRLRQEITDHLGPQIMFTRQDVQKIYVTARKIGYARGYATAWHRMRSKDRRIA